MASKKDYEAVAQIIKDRTVVRYKGFVGQRLEKVFVVEKTPLLKALTELFETDNPTFNCKKFVDACMSEWE